MGRTLNPDMYDGNAARRMPREYGEPVYNRRERLQNGQRHGNRVQNDGGKRRPVSQSGGRVAWKEPGSVSRSGRAGSGQKRSSRRKKNEMRHKILRGLCFYFFFAGIIATCWVAISFFFGRKEKVHAEEGWQLSGEAAQDGIFAEGPGEDGTGFGIDGTDNGGVSAQDITPEIRQECQNLLERQGNLLTLVNKEHALSASYSPGLRSICKGRLEAADVLYDDLCAMLEAAGDAGYQYWIASAHRDRAYQQGLVDEDVQKYMAKGYSYEAALQKTYEYTMPAGQSEHETGLALDILCSTNTIMDESQKGEPGNQWLAQHCYEYGFILRYPEDKVDITGIGYEPWHFRYVGREAAAYLTQKGWTLEEFYEALDA